MPSSTTPSFLGSAVTKVGKVAHSVTHTSPTKIRIALAGSKKQALEAERATTPTPQMYSDGGLIVGGPVSMEHHSPWDKDIPSSGEEEDEEADRNSMQTDITDNLADWLLNKQEKIGNLYSSLAEAVNFVQALENGGKLKRLERTNTLLVV